MRAPIRLYGHRQPTARRLAFAGSAVRKRRDGRTHGPALAAARALTGARMTVKGTSHRLGSTVCAETPPGKDRATLHSSPVSTLAALPVLVVDCQATFAAPRGHLIELGWALAVEGSRASAPLAVSARLVRLPEGERVPPGVSRITGITDERLASAVPVEDAWRELVQDARALSPQPAPAVAHFARFERPFLARLAGGALPLDLVCTHEIALRLLPELPRRSLRALAGYFGRSVGALRRSAEHVIATSFVWQHLATLLDERGVRSWPDLRSWLAEPVSRRARAKRGWPMPRELRLALPDRPGIYRMLRTSGDVLYVGKASSLHKRVNSYFRKQAGIHERTLEMLSQARGLSYVVAESALEAALLEPDEIKRNRPPYNEALTETDRAVWFARADLSARSARASTECTVGPFASGVLLDRLDALTSRAPTAVAPERWAPSAAVFEEGLALLRRSHRELAQGIDRRPLLVLGARLWREGRRLKEQDHAAGALGNGQGHPSDAGPLFARVWTPPEVATEIEGLALQCAHAIRRARWLTGLVESTVTFHEPLAAGARLLVLRDGEIVCCERAEPGAVPPAPDFYRRSRHDRHQSFTIARFDRLRVLTTELKRLVAKGNPVCVRLAPRAALSGERLAGLLGWL
jgi:DNA polymerase III subunit epsilon